MPACKYGDPYCPCQDGDACCHYEGVDPATVPPEFVLTIVAKNVRLSNALRMAARNDRSHYNHHEARPFDGRKPMEAPEPGSIWLTPREIARRALNEPDLATVADVLS